MRMEVGDIVVATAPVSQTNGNKGQLRVTVPKDVFLTRDSKRLLRNLVLTQKVVDIMRVDSKCEKLGDGRMLVMRVILPLNGIKSEAATAKLQEVVDASCSKLHYRGPKKRSPEIYVRARGPELGYIPQPVRGKQLALVAMRR